MDYVHTFEGNTLRKCYPAVITVGHIARGQPFLTEIMLICDTNVFCSNRNVTAGSFFHRIKFYVYSCSAQKVYGGGRSGSFAFMTQHPQMCC